MIVVVGEALVDIVVTPGGERHETVGGSPMNVAVGLGRLDVPTQLFTQLGDDDHGQRIIDHVTASRVSLMAAPQPGNRTSTATATLDADRAARYRFDLDWSLPFQELPTAKALHVGSLAAVLEPGAASVRSMVDQAASRDLLVSYDPNIRPAFVTDPEATWRQVLALAAGATLIKVSDEDLAVLRPREEVAVLAAELLAGERTQLVLVTHGGAGASAYTGDHVVRAGAPVTEVVDTVGAGDSLMSAVLAVLHDWDLLGQHPALPPDEARLRTLLTSAMAAAAITCARPGANPPTRAELPPGWPG